MNVVKLSASLRGHPKVLMGVNSVGRIAAFEVVCQWFEPTTPCQIQPAPNHQQIIMPNIFFISDLHLGHTNILGFTRQDGTPLRPGFNNIDEHDSFVIESINKVVKPSDRLVVVGDCVMNKKHMHKLNSIAGRKTLVMGNHDPRAPEFITPYFEHIGGAIEIDNFIVTHIPVHPFQVGPRNRYRANIHGHLHGHPVFLHASVEEGKFNARDPRYFNVSVESCNYKPVPLSYIKAAYPE